jgi:hypothetical protein
MGSNSCYRRLATFENWNREVVQVTAVWDLSVYNTITTESVKDVMVRM